MPYRLAVNLSIAWFLGVVGTYTIGAMVHVLFDSSQVTRTECL
jgi:hypothetical protein